MSADFPSRARTWGSPEWFGFLLKSQGRSDLSAYFALNGYHLFRHARILDALKRAGMPAARDAMLDVGCGTGHLTELIRTGLGFGTASAADFVPDLVSQVANRYPEIDVQIGGLPALSYPNETFDLVIAAEVLYYLDEKQRRVALNEIVRVLKPQGVILFTSALGDRYFNSRSAIDFVSTRFHIVRASYSHNSLFHATVGRLALLKRLDHVIHGRCGTGTTESQQRLDRSRWLVNRRLFQFALRGVCWLSEPLLRSTSVCALTHALCETFAPHRTKTNITIVARKDQPCHPA